MLNGTFLVQAIHFFIAYLIMDRLLLRPVVRVITQDQQEKKQAQQAVQYEADTVKQLEHDRSRAWNATCKAFVKEMPPIKRFGKEMAQPHELPDIHVLSAHEVNQLIDQCVDKVIQEVEHVH